MRCKLSSFSLANLGVKNFTLGMLCPFNGKSFYRILIRERTLNTTYTGNLHSVLEAGPYLYRTPYTDRSTCTALEAADSCEGKWRNHCIEIFGNTGMLFELDQSSI